MHRRPFIGLIALAPFSQGLFATSNLSQSFEVYKRQQQQDFYQFKIRYRSALALYKREILKHWREARVPTQKEYVRYSDQLKVRSSVDFEQQTITIEAQAATPTAAGEKIKKALTELLTLDTQSAQQEDPVLQMLNQPSESSLIEQQEVKERTANGEVSVEHAVPIVADLFPQQSVQQILAPAKKEIIRDKQQVAKVTIKLPKGSTGTKAKQFLPIAQRYAEKENIPVAWVMTVMHVESYFNPMARSHVPAFGLMQIVPKSAGLDTTEYLTGKSRYLTAEELYQPEVNIQNGAAYLHLLYYRYLNRVKDEQSRFYCAIAAYNTGSGNVARAFVSKRDVRAAAETINALSSDQVYQQLVDHLPYQETRRYLKKVNNRLPLYL